MSTKKIAVVTGASSGIGEATARALAQAGFQVFIGARRIERIRQIAQEIDATGLVLDVTDPQSVRDFVEQIPESLDVLVNNAGGALGLERIADAVDEHWQTMFATNVLGAMRMTRDLLPRLSCASGHIINVTSIAGRETYIGGAGYTAAKHAARAMTETLRLELNGTAIRVTDIAPGMVETEFSETRFFGNSSRAKEVYAGVTPLTAKDIADCIVWCINRPKHVNIDELVVKPVAQARVAVVARNVGL